VSGLRVERGATRGVSTLLLLRSLDLAGRGRGGGGVLIIMLDGGLFSVQMWKKSTCCIVEFEGKFG
jgi:hypothetical protein